MPQPQTPARRKIPKARKPETWENRDRLAADAPCRQNRAMRLGIVLFTSDRGITPARAAKAAEDRGFETFWVPEHTHIPVKRTAPHPSTGDETLPDDRYQRTLDPWVALAGAAAVTTRIELATAVALPVEHDPITLAKTIASLDHLSRRPGDARRRLRLEHRRARRPQRAGRQATHRPSRVPGRDARAVVAGRSGLRRRVRALRAELGVAETGPSAPCPSSSAPAAPTRPSPGSRSTPTVGSRPRATTTWCPRSCGCAKRGRAPAASGAPRVVALEGRPDAERLQHWSAGGVTDVALGLPDRDADEVEAYLDRLRSRLDAMT